MARRAGIAHDRMMRFAVVLTWVVGCSYPRDPVPASSPKTESAAPTIATDGAVTPMPDAPAATAAEPEVPPAGKLTTEKAAVAAFRAMWDAPIAPHLATTHWAPSVPGFTTRIHAKELAATKQKCREQHATIVSIIGPVATANVVFGSLPRLARDGDCWLVHTPVIAFTELWGYLDAATGELIVIWNTIEG